MANSAGSTLGGIRISSATSATIEGGSILSLTGDNLHLEKNTTFRLVLNQSAGVGDDDQ